MPTYAYTCTACGHSFDIHQSFTEDALAVCPECDGRLRKVFSAVGVVFKGSGFYRTDSKSAKKSSTAAATTSTSDSGTSTTSTEKAGTSTPSTSSTPAPAAPAATKAPAAAGSAS